jgi:hypothetical protein
MPNLDIPFGGSTLVIPGAYYADNVQAAAPSAPAVTPPLIYIGFGYGQKPFTPVTYTGGNVAQDLLSAIRGGPASGFVPFLTSPSPQLNGAQQVTFINVGGNTQSTLTLDSIGASGIPQIVLTSTNYGLPSNLLQAEVSAGSLAGNTLTIYDGYANVTAVGTNLGVPFQLAYTGSASGVTYSVVYSGGVASTFQVHSPNVGESFTIPLGPGSFATITQLVEYLNGTGFYSATAISSTGGNLPTTQLDAASGVGLPAAPAPYTFENVTSTLNDPIYWINQLSGGLATAALASGAVAASGLANIPLTPFTGATSVPPTLSSYASGFNVALGIPGWTVFADSGASGVYALGVQHALTASQPGNGKWRRFFSGSQLGDSVATAISRAQSGNSITTCYLYPGIYRTDTNTGLNTLYDGLHAAAAACGMATGNPPATPLTNKALTGNGTEVNLTVSQIDQLQQAGVMPLWVSPQTGVPTIVSDFTTWQSDANPENVFTQQVACRWFLAYSMVNSLSPYVGTIAAVLTETMILNAVKATLNALVYSTGNANGVISSWDPTSLKLVYTGAKQLAAITVDVTLVGQNRFITEYVNIQPLNLTITSAAA